MMLQFRRWLAPPVFSDDESKTRRANLLNSALINIATLVPVLYIGNFLGGKTPIPVFGTSVLAIAFFFVLRSWMYRGRVRLASIGLLTIGLVLITASVVSLGTIRAPTTAMYLLLVIAGGFLFVVRGMMITTALCSLLIGGLIGAENAGLLPRPDYSVTITEWFAYTAIFAWTGSLAFSALQMMHQALARADKEITERKRAEEVLRQAHDELEGRVVERTATLARAVEDLKAEITERKRAEEALQASEVRYRRLFESAKDGILILDADSGHIVDVNPFLIKMLGYTREEFLGKELWQIGLFKDFAASNDAFIELHNTGYIRYEDLPLETRYGNRAEVEFVSNVYLVDNTKVIQCNIRDITARKQREHELESIAMVSAALRTAGTRAEMLPLILDQALDLLKMGGAALALRDPVSKETLIELGRGAFASWTNRRLPPGEGVSGNVIATGTTYVSGDVASDPHFKHPDLIGDLRAAACVPLTMQEQIIGALWVGTEAPISEPQVRLLTAIADIAANALHRTTLHEQTEQRFHQLQALHAIDTAIAGSADLHLTLNVFLEQLIAQLHIDAADILLLTPSRGTLDYAAGRGFRSKAIERSHMRLDEGYAGRATLERRVVCIPNLAEVTNFVRLPLLAGEGFATYYGVPLIAKGQSKGILEIFHRSPHSSDPEWLEFLQALASQASIAIDNASLFDGLQRSNLELAQAYEATIEGWSRALDLRDKETEGHTQRVTTVTMRLAAEMGVDEKELVHVRYGALLHDIGKMGVPDSILLKPGPLTDEEWVVMKKHPTFSYEMLSPIAYLRPALDIPYCHHEKWDGAGYPRGLKGEQIPLVARIFAVVDVWDALCSDRPYRAAWSKEKAREHIRAGSGTHFDSKAVEHFLRISSGL